MKNTLYIILIASNTLAQNKELSQSEYLSNKGLPISIQKTLLPSAIDEMYEGFLSNRYPTDISFSQYPWKYSLNASKNSKIYNKDNKEAFKIVKKRLNLKKHAHRTGNESQNINKLRTVDKHMLCLIYEYLDLFDNNKNWFFMQNWFPDGENSSEKGGIVFAKKSLEAKLIDTQWQKERYTDNNLIQSKQVYLFPIISRHIQRIGNIHTHPKIGKPKEYAGPAGELDSGPLFLDNRPIAYDDLTCLTKDATTNPLQMDAVVSWINKSTINLDVYFRNISFTNNIPYNMGKTIVVDLGNFKVSN